MKGAALSSYRDKTDTSIRALFCIGIRDDFFAAPASDAPAIIAACREALDNLGERFGVTVLGTMDDDEIMVGPSYGFPWTAYILADVPNYEAAVAVCNTLRETPVGDAKLWKYMRIEARLGRPLFFGNS